MTSKNLEQWKQAAPADLARLPGRIEHQIKKLNELDRKVRTATSKASTAAGSAKQAADTSRGGFLGMNNTGAVEALQKAGVDTAQALVSAAEAQTVQFQLQTDLAEVTKSLFALGVTSVAMNRTTIQELELQLTGASKSKLTALARREIRNVIDQLRAQQDILLQQERQGAAIQALQGLADKTERACTTATEQIGRLSDDAAKFTATTTADISRTDSELIGLLEDCKALRTSIETTVESVEVLRRDTENNVGEVRDRVVAGEAESQRRLVELEEEGQALGARIAANVESIELLRHDAENDVGEVRDQVAATAEAVAVLRQDGVETVGELRFKMVAGEAELDRRWTDLEARLTDQARRIRLQFWTTSAALAVGATGVVLALTG